MVNVYGGDGRKRGPPGPPGEEGPPGKRGPPGEGLSSTFFSKQLAQWFYENLSYSFYFPDKTSGLIYDKDNKPIGIKNWVAKNHALTKNKVESMIKISDYGYGLQFTNSLYEIKNIDFATGEPSKAILVFAFKVDAWAKDYQYIFHDTNDDRCVFLKDDDLIIKSSKTNQVAVKYAEDEWNICYIEFNSKKDTLSYYQINEETGSFKTVSESHFGEKILYIGGKESHYFEGLLARIDIYILNPYEGTDNLSQAVRKSVIRQFYTIPEDES